jgi:hypothetical protein
VNGCLKEMVMAWSPRRLWAGSFSPHFLSISG